MIIVIQWKIPIFGTLFGILFGFGGQRAGKLIGERPAPGRWRKTILNMPMFTKNNYEHVDFNILQTEKKLNMLILARKE